MGLPMRPLKITCHKGLYKDHHLKSQWRVMSSLDMSTTNVDCSKQAPQHAKHSVRYRTRVAQLWVVAEFLVYNIWHIVMT